MVAGFPAGPQKPLWPSVLLVLSLFLIVFKENVSRLSIWTLRCQEQISFWKNLQTQGEPPSPSVTWHGLLPLPASQGDATVKGRRRASLSIIHEWNPILAAVPAKQFFSRHSELRSFLNLTVAELIYLYHTFNVLWLSSQFMCLVCEDHIEVCVLQSIQLTAMHVRGAQ